jgi:hypothetical protein
VPEFRCDHLSVASQRPDVHVDVGFDNAATIVASVTQMHGRLT